MTKRSPKPKTRSARFRIYEVEDGPAEDGGHVIGRVLLHEGADRFDVEHALSAVGRYCPRGADTLEWQDGDAVVCNYAGEVLVRLYHR